MHELISAGLWKKLETLAKKNKPWAGAIAYFSDASRLEFGRGDILVINASDPAIASGQTSAAAISAAQKRGAALYSLANLHAKLLVLGKFAVIGSANASKSSDNSLIEASIVTSDPGIRSQARAFIAQLVQLATRIDSKFLQRIEQIPVSQRRGAGAGGNRKPSSVHIRNPRVWIAGVREMADDAHPEEADDIEAGTEEAREHLTDPDADIDWIRFVGQTQFRIGAKRGDAVIQVWTPLGAKRAWVCKPATILRRQDEEGYRTRFFLEEASDDDALPLAAFRKLAIRAGIRRRIGPSSAREITIEQARALQVLWPEQ